MSSSDSLVDIRLGTLLALAASVSALLLFVLTPSAVSDAGGARCGANLLFADVTGDGARDRVSLAGSWTQKGCRYFLRVNSGPLLRLREGLLEAPRVSRAARIASLRGAARIDSRPGAEILVTLNRSASGEGVGVYTVRRERLRYMSIEGKTRIDGIFWHNQAGLGGTRAACWRRPASGYVVSMSYQVDPSGRGADIRRRLWRADGLRFRRVWSRDYRRTTRTFPEQRTPGPFGNCVTRG